MPTPEMLPARFNSTPAIIESKQQQLDHVQEQIRLTERRLNSGSFRPVELVNLIDHSVKTHNVFGVYEPTTELVSVKIDNALVQSLKNVAFGLFLDLKELKNPKK